MQAESFRIYLRNNVVNRHTKQPLAERTIKKYISDIEDIERYCNQNIDSISINTLTDLILDFDRHMPNLNSKSVDNYRAPANHYVRFRQQSA
jgi:hypothetical protein